MAEKHRVGIVGCGSISHLHARGYQGVDSVEMVALADPVQAAADAFGEQYGIEKRYADFREMLDQGGPGHRQQRHMAQTSCAYHHRHLRPPPEGGALRETDGDFNGRV